MSAPVTIRHPLDNSPPRLSDLRGRALEQALATRDAANRERWLSLRAQPSTAERIAGRLGRLFKR